MRKTLSFERIRPCRVSRCAGISDMELLGLIFLATVVLSSYFIIGNWIYETKEARLVKDHQRRISSVDSPERTGGYQAIEFWAP